MEIKQSKTLLDAFSRNSRINNLLNLNLIMDKLWYDIAQEYSSVNTFEYSLLFSKNEIRLLHLKFYNPHTPVNLIKVLREKRTELITDIVKYFNHKLRYKYNFQIIKQISSFIDDTRWPIQFGYDINDDFSGAVKIYFSTIDNNGKCVDFIQKICKLLNLKWGKLEKYFSGKQFDAVGLNLLPDGHCKLKIYTFYSVPFDLSEIKRLYQEHYRRKNIYLKPYFMLMEAISLKHIGFLYRIAENSSIESVKIWMRLQQLASPSLLRKMKFKSRKLEKWLHNCYKIVNSVKSNISYLTLENKKIGFYFR